MRARAPWFLPLAIVGVAALALLSGACGATARSSVGGWPLSPTNLDPKLATLARERFPALLSIAELRAAVPLPTPDPEPNGAIERDVSPQVAKLQWRFPSERGDRWAVLELRVDGAPLDAPDFEAMRRGAELQNEVGLMGTRVHRVSGFHRGETFTGFRIVERLIPSDAQATALNGRIIDVETVLSCGKLLLTLPRFTARPDYDRGGFDRYLFELADRLLRAGPQLEREMTAAIVGR